MPSLAGHALQQRSSIQQQQQQLDSSPAPALTYLNTGGQLGPPSLNPYPACTAQPPDHVSAPGRILDAAQLCPAGEQL
jgi:hypothetical protein